MNFTAMGQTGVTGVRRRLAEPVARKVEERTSLTRVQVLAVIGGLFLLLSAYQFFRTVSRAIRAARS